MLLRTGEFENLSSPLRKHVVFGAMLHLGSVSHWLRMIGVMVLAEVQGHLSMPTSIPSNKFWDPIYGSRQRGRVCFIKSFKSRSGWQVLSLFCTSHSELPSL